MSDSESESCASSVSSIVDSITRSSSNSSASSAPAVSEKHPILVELEKWEERLYENEPPFPEDLFDETVNEATRQARQQAYTANAEAAMKDALEEYKKWWVDNAEALAFYTVATVDTKATVLALLACSGSGEPELRPVTPIVLNTTTQDFTRKEGYQAKASRRDIATLIERGRIETARVKVETIINEDIHIELLELLELYCELLIARFGILDLNSREPDPAISEGVCSSQRHVPNPLPHVNCFLKYYLLELHVLRDLLMHKYGREFSIAVMENHDGRVVRKLDIAMPSPELVNAYLAEIAKAYGVSWMSPNTPSSDDNIDDGSDGDVKVATEPGPSLPAIPPSDIDGPDNKKSKLEDATTSVSKAQPATTETPEDEFEALNRRFAALKKK
ncbi:DUF292-domain-containing protein [Armillaria solidipes]|uniref:DUF292-domain-containing protein n=1 Tax=Armillaria solidipes TaxID=1076256 RepID=A0A2H3C0K0_9AGAR|nr:DUF292-domain-containing protein [Armillaria solidipes]